MRNFSISVICEMQKIDIEKEENILPIDLQEET